MFDIVFSFDFCFCLICYCIPQAKDFLSKPANENKAVEFKIDSPEDTASRHYISCYVFSCWDVDVKRSKHLKITVFEVLHQLRLSWRSSPHKDCRMLGP